MSFFGFETSVPRDDKDSKQAYAEEDIAVYTWGDASYDALGSALEETGDDLNDETFGGGPVGKDFDFSGATNAALTNQPNVQPSKPYQSDLAPKTQQNTSSTNDLWKNVDPSSAFSKQVPTEHITNPVHQTSAAQRTAPSVFAQINPSVNPQADYNITNLSSATAALSLDGHNEARPRTMAEIEAEMHAALREQQQQQLISQQRERERMQIEQQLLMQQQQRMMEEEQLRMEMEKRRLYEQQALQDPLWAIRQAMMQENGMSVQGPSDLRPSLSANVSPMTQNRHPMSQIPHQPHPPHNHGAGNQQALVNELLLHHQRQQMLEQQGHPRPNYDISIESQDAMAADARRRMQEAEMMEARHRRRMAKIQSMARYNDIMTQSDKDFITRVQVAQLVTSDPYADDFYAQVYASIRQQRIASENQVLKGAPRQGGQRGPHRRENAIQRMQAHVERIVSHMKSREQSKEASSHNPGLQNVLGKTSGRSYKAAPRQLLQVATASPDSRAHHPVKEHDSVKSLDSHVHHGDLPPPFSPTEGLMIIERLFNNILEIEQLRRNKPLAEDEARMSTWKQSLDELLDTIWQGLRVVGPLYETNPHPFIALIAPMKGKRFIGRLGRDLTDEQKLMTLGVIVNRIEQLDVIRGAAILDSVEDSPARRMFERQAGAFQENVINQGLHLSPSARTLKTYTALIELMIENLSTFSRVVITRPGLTLLEHFFAEASLLKHGLQGPEGEHIAAPAEDVAKWSNLYDRVFEHLLPLWNIMFPSTRILAAFPPNSLEAVQVSVVTDGFDLHVWRFLAGFALEGTLEQHSRLVTQLRAKVMGTLRMAQALEEGKAKARKIRNVDLFLNALGLSSTQILEATPQIPI
ncbi:hypothetical protein PIIN_03482 [Serendipita indica DSM 11827]|uniref:mRNA decay factor PAT1 domain-containing protein n=1 Tax=Serendipita indica (strain DSM 11827) TaxID=1109443 RepID=G4TDX7_SERID|nr:hypothetical protein PIIN_03482 [Serendipita indica DSM 11827]